MAPRRASLAEIGGFYARQLASPADRTTRAWHAFSNWCRVRHSCRQDHGKFWWRKDLETPSADPAYLYQNTLVALDADRGINNGEPFLDASWIGAAAPQPGETITHVGAGTGYYSAILSMLVLPGGHLNAFEIHEELAEAARRNLSFENASVIAGNAALLACHRGPDLCECRRDRATQAMAGHTRPGGRIIFPGARRQRSD